MVQITDVVQMQKTTHARKEGARAVRGQSRQASTMTMPFLFITKKRTRLRDWRLEITAAVAASP